MRKVVTRKTCAPILTLVLLLIGSGLHAQTIGARPGVAFYSGAVGFEGLLEGRYSVPLFEGGPGHITTSVFVGYSHVAVNDSTKHGLMLGAGGGYELRLGSPAVYATPGLFVGVEFSQFDEADVDSSTAIMLIPYLEAGYEFDFNLSVGLQLGLKTLLYIGDDSEVERSLTFGPVVLYRFGD